MPGLKKAGSQWQGPCPNCGGIDRFRVNMDGKFFCRHCLPDGSDPNAMKSILDAAGFETGGQAQPHDTLGVVGFSRWW